MAGLAANVGRLPINSEAGSKTRTTTGLKIGNSLKISTTESKVHSKVIEQLSNTKSCMEHLRVVWLVQ